jgi:hypothetical protein
MEVMSKSYNPDSKILIITLDSFFKKSGGTQGYDPLQSICHELPDHSKRIIEVRQKIFSLLKKDEIRWENDTNELKLNQEFLNAPDFGGEDTNALFMQAIHRYTGDFYQALGSEGKKRLLNSKHHFLIISACYGVLKPTEQIQNYACQFGIPPNKSFSQWVRRKKDITNIVAAYVEKHGIQRVYDFTQCAVPAYQAAVSWDIIRQKIPEISIFHAYTWVPYDRSLRVFGEFVLDQMLFASEEELLRIEANREFANLKFHKKMPDIEQQIKSPSDPIELILDNDENDFVEFKSCAFGGLTPEKMRMLTTNNAQIFSRIPDCQKIAKTLCAFMNSSGGDLIIGVKERNELERTNQPIGIESEMRKIEAAGYSQTTDGYARLVQDGIIDVFIPDYNPATKCIKKSEFREINTHTICWIHVEPSKIPMFLIDNYREGKYCFYIRDGGRSIPLRIKKAAEYILVHFCPKQ